MFRYFKKYQISNKLKLEMSNFQIENEIIIRAINNILDKHASIKLISPKNSRFLKDEIEWIKACNIIDIETYQNIDRIGRSNGVSGTPQKLFKNSEVREAIFELMMEYDLS